MHTQNFLSLVGLYAASVALAQSPQSLVSVLQQNGFTEFAQRLQAGPPVFANPGIIVYAPVNSAFTSRSNNATVGNATVARRVDSTDLSSATNTFNFFNGISNQYPLPTSGQNSTSNRRMGKRANSPGTVQETLYTDPSVSLGSGNNQTLVERSDNSSALPLVFSGLGQSARVTGVDIPFDTGFIRPIDSLLTLPRNLTATLQALGQVRLLQSLQQANLTETVDSLGSITLLAPSNEVFTLSSALTQAQVAQVIQEHIIVSSSFPVYSPWLLNGQTFRTLGGTTISVVVRGGVPYLNGARILAGDTLIENGVIHTIDKLLSGSIPTVPTADAITVKSLSWETMAFAFITTAVVTRQLYV